MTTILVEGNSNMVAALFYVITKEPNPLHFSQYWWEHAMSLHLGHSFLSKKKR